jgi:MFS family permease
MCVVFFAMSAMTFPQFLILMVQQPVATGIGLGVTATVAGLIKLPGNIVTTLSAPLDGYLVSRFGARTVIVLGGVLAGIGYIGFILADQQIVAFIAFSVLATGGGTMIYVAAPTIIVRNAPSDRTSEAIGVMTVLRSMFQAVGVQMTMLPLALYTKPGSSYPEAEGFLISLGFLTVMTFTAALVALLFLRRGDSAQPAQAA